MFSNFLPSFSSVANWFSKISADFFDTFWNSALGYFLGFFILFSVVYFLFDYVFIPVFSAYNQRLTDGDLSFFTRKNRPDIHTGFNDNEIYQHKNFNCLDFYRSTGWKYREGQMPLHSMDTNPYYGHSAEYARRMYLNRVKNSCHSDVVYFYKGAADDLLNGENSYYINPDITKKIRSLHMNDTPKNYKFKGDVTGLTSGQNSILFHSKSTSETKTDDD